MQYMPEYFLRAAGGGGVFDVWDASAAGGVWETAGGGGEEEEEEEGGRVRGRGGIWGSWEGVEMGMWVGLEREDLHGEGGDLRDFV